MQRFLVVVSVLVVIAVGAVAAVSLGAHAVHAQAAGSAASAARPAATHRVTRPPAARVATTPTITVPAQAGHTCYVSVPRCSQTPCIEYINAHAMLIAPAPGVRLATPARCPSATGPSTGALTATPRGRVGPATASPNFGAALPGLAHKLQARPAGFP
jgi:hypothetical protein